MSKQSARGVIRLRGVRHNNLKNLNLDLPLNRLIVVTGLSGSGKSSLAFDTLFAEGQRRYIETFSPYARQFLDRMDKPKVDSIEGIPPAIAIEQRNSVRTTRSTVGTMTEICDYMKLLWPHVAQLHCRQCGKPVRKDSPRQIWERIVQEGAADEKGSFRPLNAGGGPRSGMSPGTNPAAREVLVTFAVPLSEKLSLDESLALVARQGYQRLLVAGKVLRLDESAADLRKAAAANAKPDVLRELTIVQDRIKVTPGARARFVEACEQAYHFGKGKLSMFRLEADASPSAVRGELRFSNSLHCAGCDLEYHEPSPALFSFNHPVGACPTCRGFGRIISIDYDLALPDRSKTLAQGVVKPWQSGLSAECQTDLLRMCKRLGVPTNVPFENLPTKWRDLVLEGEPDYGKDKEHEWPRAWYGIKGYFRWLESQAYKMHVRVLLSRYRAYTHCPACQGKRFQPESLLYRIHLPQDNPLEPAGNRPDPTGVTNGTLQAEPRDRLRQKGPLAPALFSSEGERGNQVGAVAQLADASITLAAFYQLPIRRALALIEQIEAARKRPPNDPVALALTEVHSRLAYLDQVGLGYLTLDRPTRSLSGGETERVSLTTCLGTRLVNTLFVLDEPSVGLHARDTERLINVLQQLRDGGNTVLVVEHEASVMRAADQIIDLGPGHGATGGALVFQGSFKEILNCRSSLTGQYLSGRKQIPVPARRGVPRESSYSSVSRTGEFSQNSLVLNDATLARPSGEHSWQAGGARDVPSRTGIPGALRLTGATLHNLQNLSVEIPLSRFVCVTGVSGSGKTTLIREVLLPALTCQVRSAECGMRNSRTSDRAEPQASQAPDDDDNSALRTPHSALLEGWQHLARVVLVDQAILAKTPRSNPAVYTGAFDDIRELYAQSDLARRRGLHASAFSFNSAQGQCERCRGAGFEKIEMQFLSDVYIRCPDCDGRRYRAHILEIKLAPPPAHGKRTGRSAARSIADLLDSTVEQAISFLECFTESRPAQRAVKALKLLEETGLGYLKLGQPINTLSGGESQRLKLVKHLAESLPCDSSTLFLFDEPTTGLHFEDVRVLLKVFQRLVAAGHSVVVIEHNLDVIKSADWIIDLGPEAGDQGGRIVAQGTPEQVAETPGSFTGQALRQVLARSVRQPVVLHEPTPK